MQALRVVLMAVGLGAAAMVGYGQGGVDFSKVEVKAHKVNDKFYTLEGMGGTIGVLFGPDGVFMVDTQFAPLSQKIVAAIRGFTQQPIRYVVNTHLHGDHTGGNENFGKLGATIISREQLRWRLAHPNALPNGQPGTPMAAAGLPGLTYRDRMTLYLNGEEVQLIAMQPGHTDGDTMIVFPGFDTIMTGDFFRSIQYPVIDRNSGGTLVGLLDELEMVIGRAGPGTKIIPGHGPTVDRMAVMAQRDLVLLVRDRVAGLLAQGKSEDEVVAAKVTADLDAKVPQGGTNAERFVRAVYGELKARL